MRVSPTVFNGLATFIIGYALYQCITGWESLTSGEGWGLFAVMFIAAMAVPLLLIDAVVQLITINSKYRFLYRNSIEIFMMLLFWLIQN